MNTCMPLNLVCFVYLQGQGAITEKLRSFSMADLTQIPQDEAGGQLYLGYSNPARKGMGTTQPDGTGTYFLSLL